MRWAALNTLGALMWLAGLTIALGASPGGWDTWLPTHPLVVGALFGFIGLATLLWANVSDA